MRHILHRYVIFCSVVLCVTFCSISAFSQGDTYLKTEAFGKLERPVSAFDHDTHNEKAQAEDCSICHHVYDENGKKVEGESSEDKPCSECHALKAQGRQPGLRMAYHQQCKKCHVEAKKGPVACGECHVK